MKVIKELIGHSGSQILLVQDPDIRVRKIGNVDRNLERYNNLSTLNLPMPKILSTGRDSYDMEYITALDIRSYLLTHRVDRLAEFLSLVIEQLRKTSVMKNYRSVYEKKVDHIDFSELKFSKQDLLDRAPLLLAQSEYHGDLTLENILYDVHQDRFVLIDPLTTDYDSWVFDLAKLRQDITCHWFIRNQQFTIHNKLNELREALSVYEYFDNDCTLILMLLRVLPYLRGQDRHYIINEANKLWK